MKAAIHVARLAYPFRWTEDAFFAEDHVMELSLQFGHGMIGHTEELLEEWGSGAAVLSPRDLTAAQLIKLGKALGKLEAEVFIDPQCFGRSFDHHRLTQHDYWSIFGTNPTASFMGGGATAQLVSSLYDLCRTVGATAFIAPGLLGEAINEDWFVLQEAMLQEAAAVVTDIPVFATVALSASSIADERQIEELVERSRSWPVSGFYVVLETARGAYLIDDPVWLANALNLLAGLAMTGKRTLLGYANHQMLLAAAAGVSDIASGTWLNVRSFAADKFYSPDPDSVARRTTWYYCPQALSEYQIPFLDIAYRAGSLRELEPPTGFPNSYASPLFIGALPTSVNWPEQKAFRHYLSSVRHQAKAVRKESFASTFDALRVLLDDAQKVTERLQDIGVFSRQRGFDTVFDACRSALAVLRRTRGAKLERGWAQLHRG